MSTIFSNLLTIKKSISFCKIPTFHQGLWQEVGRIPRYKSAPRFSDLTAPLFGRYLQIQTTILDCSQLIFSQTLKYTKPPPLEDTALHLAARKRDNDMVKLFIETGAVVDSQNVRRIQCITDYITLNSFKHQTGSQLFDRHFFNKNKVQF